MSKYYKENYSELETKKMIERLRARKRRKRGRD